MAEPLEEGAQRRNETQTPQTQTSPGPSTAQDRQATPTQEVPAGNKQPSQQEPTQQPPRQLQPRPGETQTNPGPSTAATQQLPADGVRDDQQTTQSSSRQPSQQEPTQQPPPQLQPRPGETQTNPGPSTAATQQLPADGVRDDQQTTQSSSRQPSQQEPMPQPPPQLQPRPGETQTNPGPSTAATQQLPADGVRDDQQTTQSGSRQPSQQEPMPQPPPQLQPRPGEAQINPGPSTAPSQQLPADGVRDDQQTTQSGSRQPSQQEPTQQPPPQLQPRLDNVMKAQEADANERAKKRKAEATVLKDQGNQAFKKSDYTRAIELYTQGLEHLKDFVVLYTNRAQAYNKLEKFTEAMVDCRTALQLEPNNVKALVHLGKAQQGLKDYEAAVSTYQEILNIDEKYENMVAGYIAAVNLAESTAKSDMEAERLFSEGDVKATGVHEIGLSGVADSQAALTQQLPDDQQTTQSGSRQPSQQEPTQQPPPQLQPGAGITDPVLRKISERLGSEWRKLATHLGLSAAEIERIVMDNPGQTENQIFNMLVKWRCQQSTSVDQRDVLCTALMEIGRRDIVENLLGRYQNEPHQSLFQS
ncbi:chromatin modification-related protein eaf-1-like [Patiria miniata]|uniref:Death domain-containing protein n=1 Tax=Patiria miniata TaxID=46514 RepID=A0A914AGH5_PATMI|nr:chromatin modification-related protein eaf-1-like [Patiria miniata]